MPRYVDADALKKAFVKPINDFATGENNSLDIGEIIDAQPTADVVEVTRCKDCMHSEIDKYAPAECQNRCKLSQQYHEPTFFCKCGEPRTDLLEWIHRGDDDEQGV